MSWLTALRVLDRDRVGGTLVGPRHGFGNGAREGTTSGATLVRRISLLLLLSAGLAQAHVGSPDVFYEGNAGPYAAMVTIRPPAVIPGVAEVEIRIPADGVREVRVVPLPLTGVGSEHPPTPDVAKRDAGDSHFFTSSVWLMALGSYQVRVST